MTSSKELFASGLNYILRDIKDTAIMIKECKECLNYLKATTAKKPVVLRRIARIESDLIKLKKQLKKYKAEFKMYKEKFSYTNDDLKKFNIHPATDDEIEQDYIKDMKEVEFDKQQKKGGYTWQDHCKLIDKVNELNKIEDLPLLKY